MLGNLQFPKRTPARTHRGERPDKMRHPQSWNSTDVMESLMDSISKFNNTTIVPLFNPNCHKKIDPLFRTLELFLGSFWPNCQYLLSGNSLCRREGKSRRAHRDA
jgi:hypothetical protein